MLTILITGAGAPGTPGTVFCLRNNGEQDVRIIGCDADPETPGGYLVDKVFHIPRPDHPRYLPMLIEVCRAEKVDVILPQTTAEVAFLSRTKHQVRILGDAGTRVACANGHAVTKANDKAVVMRIFADLGLPSPKFTMMRALSDLYAAGGVLGYPFVVKPASGNGSRGVRIVNQQPISSGQLLNEKPGGLDISIDHLADILSSDFPELIAMEYLDGPEYSVDCFRGLHTECYVPRLRKKMRGGICTHAVIDLREDMIEMSRSAAKALSLTGAFGFQYRLDAAGVPKVIECNPRVQGTMVASYFAGLNAPWLAVREAMMDFPTQITLTDGRVEYIRQWGGIGIIDGTPLIEVPV